MLNYVYCKLSKTDQASYLRLLQLFAFGTMDDYNSTRIPYLMVTIEAKVAYSVDSKDALPPLNQAQLTKLRLLTIITLSLENRVRLNYLAR